MLSWTHEIVEFCCYDIMQSYKYYMMAWWNLENMKSCWSFMLLLVLIRMSCFTRLCIHLALRRIHATTRAFVIQLNMFFVMRICTLDPTPTPSPIWARASIRTGALASLRSGLGCLGLRVWNLRFIIRVIWGYIYIYIIPRFFGLNPGLCDESSQVNPCWKPLMKPYLTLNPETQTLNDLNNQTWHPKP